MSSIPSSTILSNELKLHDFKGSKMSMTYGDADINDGYSFCRMNYTADDYKLDFWQDKPTFNIVSEDFTLNDGKIWTQFNHGPNSGLNADMVDGLHAVDFKDRYGHHHFIHMFKSPPGIKRFVKIATLVPRRVGNAPAFNTEGTPPYNGIFPYTGTGVTSGKLKDTAVIGQMTKFAEDTPEDLSTWEYDVFHETDMLVEGIYNANLRASVTLLKNNTPTTFDVHLGLFSDPTSLVTDGWEDMHKFFYVSLHDELLDFIDEEHPTTTDPNDNPKKNYTNPTYELKEKLILSGALTGKFSEYELISKLLDVKNEYLDDVINNRVVNINEEFNKLSIIEQDAIIKELDELEAALTIGTEILPDLNKPAVDQKSDDWYTTPTVIPGTVTTQPDPIDISRIPLVTPPDPSKDYKMQPPFEPFEHEGTSYQYCLDIMRLYHVDSLKEIVDGVQVVTHKFDLYVCVDDDTEVHAQPYMSSACLMGNFKKPLTQAQLPTTTRYMCPRSIYDKRYAHRNHRHYDLEARLWAIVEEVDAIWDMFDNYVPVEQGIGNARKVMVTDNAGRIVAIPDQMVRNQDDRRHGNRVFVSSTDRKLGESSITTSELETLAGMTDNINDKFRDIIDAIGIIVSDIRAIIEVLDQLYAYIKALIRRTDELDEKFKLYVKKAGDIMTGDLVMDDCDFKLGTDEYAVTIKGSSDPAHDFSLVDGKGAIPMFYLSEDSDKLPSSIKGGAGILPQFASTIFGNPGDYTHTHDKRPHTQMEMAANLERRGVMNFNGGIAIDGIRLQICHTETFGSYNADLRIGDVRIATTRNAPDRGLSEISSKPIPIHPHGDSTGLFIYQWCFHLGIYRWINAFQINKRPATEGDNEGEDSGLNP